MNRDGTLEAKASLSKHVARLERKQMQRKECTVDSELAALESALDGSYVEESPTKADDISSDALVSVEKCEPTSTTDGDGQCW